MKVLVCGSRDWVDQKSIERELKELPSGTTLIHGACRGADNIAAFVGERMGLDVRPYPADWSSHGRGAGPIRNQQMIDEEHTTNEPINRVMAFHKDPNLGTGTADMKRRAVAAGITFEWFSS